MREHAGGSRVTIGQVAAHSGVSVSAVSKVLRNAYGVSDALRARVTTSIAELGYRPLDGARGMRGRTYTLGVVLPDIRNPLFAEILDGWSEALVATPYKWVIGVAQSAAGEVEVIEGMIDRQVDGIVIVGSRQDEVRLGQLSERLPIVALGFHSRDRATFDTVNGDDIEGGRVATSHLIANGYLHVAMISLDDPTSSIVEKRELGYRRAMVEHGLGRMTNIVRVANRGEDIRIAADALLRSWTKPFAVFCWSDTVALEFDGRAIAAGYALPADVGVIGYDNSGFCDLGRNSLSSVDQSGAELGEQAGRLLVARIEGGGMARHRLITPHVVARASTS